MRRFGRGLVLGVAVAWVLGSASSASGAPARYVYEMCDSALPGGGTPGIRWAQSPGQPWAATNSCAQAGGYLGVNLNGSTAGGNAEWGLPVAPPPGTKLESVSVLGGGCGDQAGLRLSVLSLPDWPPATCSDEVRSMPLASWVRGYLVELACTGVYGSCGAGPWVRARDFATVIADEAAPKLLSVGGSLLAGGVIRGHQTLAAKAHDEGGGISEVWATVNGIAVEPAQWQRCHTAHARNESVTGTVAATISPCPAEAQANWTLDTDQFPFHDGLNGVAICASDFATLSEPNTACSPTADVTVDNSCTPSAVPGGEELSAEFTRSHAETVTVPYGKGATISGRVATASDDPVPGATVCVKEQTLGVDPEPRTVAAVPTDARGVYSFEVAAGPNRQFVVGYRNDSHQVAREVRYFSHTQPTLKLAPPVLHNGERVRLWGRLPGPRAGRRVIVLQANVPGSKRWITFRRATSNRGGGFHSGYRFTSTTRRTRYRFRAVVPRQAGYPWVEGHSKPAAVVVRPRSSGASSSRYRGRGSGPSAARR